MTIETIDEVRVGAVHLRMRQCGQGPTVVFLHGDNGQLFAAPFIEALAVDFRVIAPVLPGWAGTERPRHLISVDDLAYVLLDLLDSLDLRDVHLVGASIGAWTAAEVVTKSQARVASLTLCAPVGIKFAGREQRSFVDLYATKFNDVAGLMYGDQRRAPDLGKSDDAELLELAQAEEAVARFGWEPYFHSRSLRHRLHRIQIPTLVVGGTDDRFVLEDRYIDQWVQALGGNATGVSIEGAGHRIEEECPRELAEVVEQFVKRNISTTDVTLSEASDGKGGH